MSALAQWSINRYCAVCRTCHQLAVAFRNTAYTALLRDGLFHSLETKLTHADRTKNVENAFTLLRPDAIEGKHVLLVDDIITTGATISACTNVLAEAEDVKISVMTVGRTHNL